MNYLHIDFVNHLKTDDPGMATPHLAVKGTCHPIDLDVHRYG